ncbi:MAG: HlyC/CorC family transporter [Deltaproteobacteria bacterium]|nr:HlyC/CorC family transporter [Deltaproteobacteria bacterium]
MDYFITFKIVLLVFLLLLSGFFSCSEAALFSLTPLHLHKMKEERIPFLSYIHNLLSYPNRLLITLIVGNEAVNIALSVLSASLFIHWLGGGGLWVSIAVTTMMLLIFGEAVPKTFGVTYPIRLSFIVAPFISMVSYIERPVVWILEVVSDRVASRLPLGHAREKTVLTEDEFRTFVDTGEQEGALEASQRSLIHRVFELGDTPVSEVMVPRVDMFCLPVSLKIEDVLKEIIAARHGRIPIYGTDRDDILGILYAKDLLQHVSEPDRTIRLEELLRKAYFVPEERSAALVLRDFQARRIQIAIVVDEYGGVSGLVTLEDILHGLFEDIYGEYGMKSILWQRIDERTLLVSGKMLIDDLNRLIGCNLPSEDFDTVGGFVFDLFGKLPSKGESVRFGDYTFHVEKMSRTRILILKVEKI